MYLIFLFCWCIRQKRYFTFQRRHLIAEAWYWITVVGHQFSAFTVHQFTIALQMWALTQMGPFDLITEMAWLQYRHTHIQIYITNCILNTSKNKLARRWNSLKAISKTPSNICKIIKILEKNVFILFLRNTNTVIIVLCCIVPNLLQ